MSSFYLSRTNGKLWAWLWLAATVLLALVVMWRWPSLQINHSVLALLPKDEQQLAPELQDGLLSRLDRQMMWLVSFEPARDNDSVVKALAQLVDELSALPQLQLQVPITAETQQAYAHSAYQWRYQLINPQTRTRLFAEAGQYSQWVMAQLYSGFSGVSAQEISGDPLLLTRQFMLSQAQQMPWQLRDGYFYLHAEGRDWYVLPAQLTQSGLALADADVWVAREQQIISRWHSDYPQAQVLKRGALYYSDYATQQAQQEVSRLGSLTVVALLVLMAWYFASWRPLVLVLLSLGVGAFWGAALCWLWFGQIHLMTLVMSVGLIGIAVDYALYYLLEQRAQPKLDPWFTLAKVAPSLCLALGLTLLAMLCLALAPFPGIRQLALIGGAGIVAAGITVLVWLPHLVSSRSSTCARAHRWSFVYLRYWQAGRRWKYLLLVALSVYVIGGLSQLRIDDDIALLQQAPAHLVAQEQQIQQLLGYNPADPLLIVVADDHEQLLQRYQQLVPYLDEAQQRDWLRSYQRWPLPSVQQQQQDWAQAQFVLDELTPKLTALGIEPKIQPPQQQLSLEQWLATPLALGQSLRVLALARGHSALLVPLQQVQGEELRQWLSPLTFVTYLDRKGQFDALFSQYRLLISELIGVALLIILLGFVLVYGLRLGLRVALPLLGAVAVALASLGYAALPLQLFALLALLLVLGIGVNYCVFFANRQLSAQHNLMAITLALLTSLVTLGLLVFSHTTAVRSFGLVLSSGILAAYLLAPWLLPLRDLKVKAAQ